MGKTWRDEAGDEKLQINEYVSDSMYATIIDLRQKIASLLALPYGEETLYPVKILYRDQVSSPMKAHGMNCIAIQLNTIEPITELDGKNSVTFVANIEIHGVFISSTGRDNSYDKGLPVMEQLLYYFVYSESDIHQYLLKKGITFFGSPSLETRPDVESEDSQVDIVLSLDLKYNVMAVENGEALRAIVKSLYNGEVLYEEHVVGELPAEE